MRRTKNDKEEEDFLVFGYSSRLFSNEELEGRTEDSFLINWADDDNLLIDRNDCVNLLAVATRKLQWGIGYDCRVFLHDLSEKTIGSTTNIGSDEFTDAIEEELCEAERYKDLHAEMAKEKAETVEKRGKGTEIAFSYGNNEKDQDEDDLSDESDGDNSEPYEVPTGIKMPVGINLPETARKGHIIERTARFVASHGNQVEIIIKAKHRNHKERFDFLEFDHPLNSFYKYMCKLIREKKYVPPPIKPKLLPGEHTVQPKPVKDSDSDSDSEDGDYLHPLLSAKPRQSVSSPIPLPVSSNKANPYSSLYDNLYQNKQKEEPTTSKESVTESTSTSTSKISKPLPDNFENDQNEIASYNAWHQSFYGRPSVFMPNPPPRFKIPPNLVMSQINVAARYVAGNGAFSERTLLEHNNGRLNFLFPNSEYLIYYHSKVRFFQARLNTRVPAFVHSKYHRDMEPIKDLPLRPPAPPKAQTVANAVEQSTLNDLISNIPSAPLPPEPIKTKDFPDSDSKTEETDEDVKKKRKERAQQFMADIIRKKKVGGSEEKSEVKRDELIVPADIVIPNLISSLVSGQLEKITLKKETDKIEEKERDRKRRSSRSPKRRRSRSRERIRRSSRERSRERSHRRRRSRSPSYERRRRRSPSYDESDRKRRRRSRS